MEVAFRRNYIHKNILIIGAPRSGKTTLAKKFVKEKGYSLISIDNIVGGLEAYPELNISHDGEDNNTASRLAPFLEKLLIELSEGSAFYDGIKFVIEGTHIDFEQLMPFLQNDKYREKYEIIGLTYDFITEQELYDNIKKYDNEDDWTFWCEDEELRGNVRYFIERNKFFNKKFREYNIITYDTSSNREEVLNGVIETFPIKKIN